MSSRTILHVNNVCYLGGTMLNTLTYVKAYPEFHHVVLYVRDHNTDSEMVALLLKAGAEISHVPLLTHAAVEAVDPFVIFLKNTNPADVAGDPKWLMAWPLIHSHHSFVPPIRCNWRIFNSRWLREKYRNRVHGLQSDIRCIGSMIETAPLALIERPAARDRCVVGRVSSNQLVKYPTEALDILNQIHDRTDNADFFVVGAGEYWRDCPEWLKTPAVGSKSAAEFYQDMDVMVYRTDDTYIETWGRVITEAMAAGVAVVAEKKGGITEQIEHGVSGFLCECDDEFVEYATMLCRDPELRQRIGSEAREWAVREFDVSVLRRRTSDIILSALAGSHL